MEEPLERTNDSTLFEQNMKRKTAMLSCEKWMLSFVINTLYVWVWVSVLFTEEHGIGSMTAPMKTKKTGTCWEGIADFAYFHIRR